MSRGFQSALAQRGGPVDVMAHWPPRLVASAWEEEVHMGRNAAWLSDRSLEALAWIRDGCPEVAQDIGNFRRISAHALARRGLVKVNGHGASWRASITPAGLARLEAPPPAISRQDRVDTLFRRVVAAEGRLVLDDREIGMYRDEVQRLSERTPDRPKGWRLTMRSHGRHDERRTELVLERYFSDDVEEVAVPIPEHVSRYHPVVKAFLASRDWQFVGKEHLPRAARILQALVDEVPRRGIRVQGVGRTHRGDDFHRLDRSHWHLSLEAPAGTYGVRIQEVSAPGGKPVLPRGWNERRTRPAWLDARHTEFIGTGILELVVNGPGTAINGDRHRDTATIPLEEKLPRVFRRIEIHRLEAEAREEERHREAADRQRLWETAMEEARRRYREQARWDAFRERARDWREVTDLRAFVAAMRAAFDAYDGPQREDLLAHLDFAECRLDERDPAMRPALLLPEVPEPKPDDLKPFLDEWSPHGPDSLGW
jgi:hypothetical protein